MDSFSWRKTLVIWHNSIQWLVVNTPFREKIHHHNQQDGSKGIPKLDPYWKLQPVACMVNTELRSDLLSLNKDNTHSWVRISHGSNKCVMDLNNNDTEIPEDQLEEHALQLDAKDFVGRSRAKAKPQRREPAGSSSRIVPMERRNWTRETFSLRVWGFEESDSSSSSFTESTSRRWWSGSFLEDKRKIFRIYSHNLFIGLTIDGKHVWQQEEEQKGDSSTVLMIQEQLFISELFKDIQDVISLILHYRTMW